MVKKYSWGFTKRKLSNQFPMQVLVSKLEMNFLMSNGKKLYIENINKKCNQTLKIMSVHRNQQKYINTALMLIKKPVNI